MFENLIYKLYDDDFVTLVLSKKTKFNYKDKEILITGTLMSMYYSEKLHLKLFLI